MKQLLFLTFILAILVSCNSSDDEEPIQESSKKPTTTTETVLEMGTIIQYSMDSNGDYYEDAYGKYISYEFNEVVEIYYIDEQGDEVILDSGNSSGMFEINIPSRYEDLETITIYFRYVDDEGTAQVLSTDITCWTTIDGNLYAQDYLAGSDGKVWTWDTSAPDGCVWGNMGYRPFDDIDKTYNGESKWWGVTCTYKDEEGPAYDDAGNLIEGETDGCSFESQTQHMSTEHTFETSGGDLNAYMIFGSSGAVSCYDANDNFLRSGTWEITDYDETGESHRGFYQGVFNVTNGAILWPYEINYNTHNNSTEGHIIETFELIKLTDTQMMLCYPDGGDMDEERKWDWNEATFWYFKERE